MIDVFRMLLVTYGTLNTYVYHVNVLDCTAAINCKANLSLHTLIPVFVLGIFNVHAER